MLEDPSVSRTARRLNVTSPAISNALTRLRGVFDDPLFVRSGRGVVPTPRALELQPALKRAIREFEHVLSGDLAHPSATKRLLTVALSDSDQVTGLPRLVLELATRMPHARLQVISIDALLSRGGLEAGGADVALAPEQAAVGFKSIPAFEATGVLVVRKGHPLLRKRSKAREYFASLRHVDVHIALGSRGVGHALAENAMEEHGVKREVAITVPTFIAAAMVAASTDLVAGLPRRMVDVLGDAVSLVALEQFTPPGLSFPMHIVWHERTDGDPVCRLFRDILRDAIAEPPQSASHARGRG